MIIGICILALSFISLFVTLWKNQFIRVNKVIINHLSIFKDCKRQYFVFYGIPALLAIGTMMIGYDFNSELNVILGIVIAMLMSLLAILSGYSINAKLESTHKEALDKAMDQTINAIIFGSVFSIIVLFLNIVIVQIQKLHIPETISKIAVLASGIEVFFLGVVILNLLLIIKYISKLIEYKRVMEKIDI